MAQLQDNAEQKKSAASPPPYCECDIYRVFNEMENISTLLLDVRSKSDFDKDHICHSRHFAIPSDFEYSSDQQLLLALKDEIAAFKLTVASKLVDTKKEELLIMGYGPHPLLLHRLSLLFGLGRGQLLILAEPGFDAFAERFPFLCHAFVAREESEKAMDSMSIMAAIRRKQQRAMARDGSLYGRVKGRDRRYPNCVVPDRLYLGNAEHSADLDVLDKLRITHIVNATLKVDRS